MRTVLVLIEGVLQRDAQREREGTSNKGQIGSTKIDVIRVVHSEKCQSQGLTALGVFGFLFPVLQLLQSPFLVVPFGRKKKKKKKKKKASPLKKMHKRACMRPR